MSLNVSDPWWVRQPGTQNYQEDSKTKLISINYTHALQVVRPLPLTSLPMGTERNWVFADLVVRRGRFLS